LLKAREKTHHHEYF